MNVGRLVSVVSLSHIRGELLKSALTILGMALGIAVYFAIRSANENAWTSFVSSTKLIAPDSSPRLVSSSGKIPESVVSSILSVPEILSVSPRSAAFAPAFSGEKNLGTVQLLGVDFAAGRARSSEGEREGGGLELLRKKNAVLVSPLLAERLTNNELAILAGGAHRPLEIAGKLPEDGLARAYGGQLVLIDIAHFQELQETWGRVDELTLELVPGANERAVAAALAKVLPAHISLAQPDDNTRHARKMSEAFRLNLGFLSSMSLLVAIFLIYNTTSYSTLKRRHELSTLRSIGMSARDILLFLCLENAVLGIIGSLLGIAFGVALAAGAVKLVSASLSTLYMPVRVSELTISPELLIDCFLLGPAASLIGGILPILEVTARPPRETASYQQFEASFLKKIPFLAAAGAAFFVLAALTSRRALLEQSIYAGFFPPTFLLLGMAALTPLGLRLMLTCGRHVLRPLLGAEILLAMDHIQMTLRRNSVAVAALVIATGMFIGLSVMILSFRRTVEDWIAHITTADVYVGTRTSVAGPSSGTLPPDVVDFLKSYPGASDYDWVSTAKVRIGEREVRVTGARFENIARYERLLLKEPMTRTALEDLTRAENTVLVSEPFAERNGVNAGEKFLLPGLEAPIEVTIGNIFYDYSSDQGLVMIPDTLFERVFAEKRKQGVSLYLRPGESAEKVRDEIAARFPGAALTVRSNRNLREEVLRVFDDTFKITYALQGIILAISTLTVVNTVLMLMLERKREFAVLRAIGASRWSLAKMVSYESLLLGLAAAIGALVLGLLLALVLVYVVNQFFFGWSTRFVVPVPQVALTVCGVLMLSFVSGLLPGLFVAKKLDGSALSYE